MGGNVIEGAVFLLSKPVDFARVTIYSSAKKKVWGGETDKDGIFHSGVLPGDVYRIDVAGWGNVLVRLDPDKDKSVTGFRPGYWLMLLSPTCVTVAEHGT